MKDRTRENAPPGADLGADFWTSARVRYPEGKTLLSLRVDEDIVAYFRKQGKGYQSRMNAVLRAFVDAQGGKG